MDEDVVFLVHLALVFVGIGEVEAEFFIEFRQVFLDSAQQPLVVEGAAAFHLALPFFLRYLGACAIQFHSFGVLSLK